METITRCASSLCAALCALAATTAAALERADVSADENAAVVALLEAADRELDAGRPDDAVLIVERALRIEPRNPTIWLYLGLARFDQGNFAQAEALAAKSHSLAPADRSLRSRNVGLMASAQQAAGKPVSVPRDEPEPSTVDRVFAAVVEPARSYADTELERMRSAVVSSSGWRRLDDAISERVRRERAARRGQIDSRSVIAFDGRQYRRYRY